MKISAVVMAHPRRKDAAEALYNTLKNSPFVNMSITYDEQSNEWGTGKIALEYGIGKADWHVVLQDDAIISESFYDNLYNALAAVPETNLVSLYLGRVRPNEYQVRSAFNRAMRTESSWISMSTLYWGVGIAIPSKDIISMLETAERYPKKLYDRRVGQYYLENQRKVYYTTVSLVDHDYTLPSLVGHDTARPRVCHKFSGDSLITYNSKCVSL